MIWMVALSCRNSFLFLIGPSIPSGNLTGFDRLFAVIERNVIHSPPFAAGWSDFIEQNNIVICFFIKNRIPARVLQRIVGKAVGKRSMLENKF